jgi:Y-box-binding protein 1
MKNNDPRKYFHSIGNRENVEFGDIGEKSIETTNVTGPGEVPVQGSSYTEDAIQRLYRCYLGHRGLPCSYPQ